MVANTSVPSKIFWSSSTSNARLSVVRVRPSVSNRFPPPHLSLLPS